MAWANFERSEFACRCGCDRNEISDSLVDLVQEIRDQVGFALPVTSGFRCSNHPIESAKSKPGTHSKGIAADLAVSHTQARDVLAVALQLDKGGVGINQKGDGRFVHVDLDMGRRSLLWTY